jgi:HK97 family phage prohead protease
MLRGWVVFYNVPVRGGTYRGKRIELPEVFVPGCFARVLRESQQIDLLIEHNSEPVCSTAGGLFIEDRPPKGLYFWGWPDRSTTGERAVLGVRSGRLIGMSFSAKQRKVRSGDYEIVVEVEYLPEISLVDSPACHQSSVEAISPEEQKHERQARLNPQQFRTAKASGETALHLLSPLASSSKRISAYATIF